MSTYGRQGSFTEDSEKDGNMVVKDGIKIVDDSTNVWHIVYVGVGHVIHCFVDLFNNRESLVQISASL